MKRALGLLLMAFALTAGSCQLTPCQQLMYEQYLRGVEKGEKQIQCYQDSERYAPAPILSGHDLFRGAR
jgi:hypothetical protein